MIPPEGALRMLYNEKNQSSKLNHLYPCSWPTKDLDIWYRVKQTEYSKNFECSQRIMTSKNLHHFLKLLYNQPL